MYNDIKLTSLRKQHAQGGQPTTGDDAVVSGLRHREEETSMKTV